MNDDLALEIFNILTEYEIKTLGDQKALCREIAAWHVGKIPELETLKKATEALSAERAGKMVDEMESDRRISTTRHIRELRTYVDILEGKDE